MMNQKLTSDSDLTDEQLRQAKVEYLELRVLQLEQAIAEFVQRVENGEIRSSRTYKRFKEILSA